MATDLEIVIECAVQYRHTHQIITDMIGPPTDMDWCKAYVTKLCDGYPFMYETILKDLTDKEAWRNRKEGDEAWK